MGKQGGKTAPKAPANPESASVLKPARSHPDKWVQESVDGRFKWEGDGPDACMSTNFGNTLYHHDAVTMNYVDPKTGHELGCPGKDWNEGRQILTKDYVENVRPLEAQVMDGIVDHDTYRPLLGGLDHYIEHQKYVVIDDETAMDSKAFLRIMNDMDKHAKEATHSAYRTVASPEAAKLISEGIQNAGHDDPEVGSRFELHGKEFTVSVFSMAPINAVMDPRPRQYQDGPDNPVPASPEMKPVQADPEKWMQESVDGTFQWEGDGPDGWMVSKSKNGLYQFDAITMNYWDPKTGCEKGCPGKDWNEGLEILSREYMETVRPLEDKVMDGIVNHDTYRPLLGGLDGHIKGCKYVAIDDKTAVDSQTFLSVMEQMHKHAREATHDDYRTVASPEAARLISKGMENAPDDGRDIGSRFILHGKEFTVPASNMVPLDAAMHGKTTDLGVEQPNEKTSEDQLGN